MAGKTRGMTMVELLIGVVVSIFLLMAIGIRFRNIIQRARVSSAKATVSTLALALGSMKDDTGIYPAALIDLKSSAAPAHLNIPSRFWSGPYLPPRVSLIDPWGNPYFYELMGSGIFSDTAISVTGSSQIHGYDWAAGQYITDYTVASNMGILTGPGPNAFITADKQVEYAGRELEPVQIPAYLENMPFTSQDDPGVSGNCRINNNGDFYMGSWPHRPSSSLSSGRYRFNNFELASNVELIIDGSATLYILGRLRMPATADIILTEGSLLTIYLGSADGELDIRGSSHINDGGYPGNVKIYSASDKTVNLFGNVRVNADIYAPEADIRIQGSSELWGSAVAGGLQVIGNSRIFAVDTGGADYYALGSYGRDGKPGGEGFDAEIVYGRFR